MYFWRTTSIPVLYKFLYKSNYSTFSISNKCAIYAYKAAYISFFSKWFINIKILSFSDSCLLFMVDVKWLLAFKLATNCLNNEHLNR